VRIAEAFVEVTAKPSSAFEADVISAAKRAGTKAGTAAGDGLEQGITKSSKKAGPDPVELAGRLRLSVTRLARILRHQDAGTLAPTLSAALATVDRDGPLTRGDLVLREHVAPPSITKAVEKLAWNGLR